MTDKTNETGMDQTINKITRLMIRKLKDRIL